MNGEMGRREEVAMAHFKVLTQNMAEEAK